MQAPAARSYWLREGRNGAPRHEALARDLDVDAAIVGAGITGLTLATLLIEGPARGAARAATRRRRHHESQHRAPDRRARHRLLRARGALRRGDAAHGGRLGARRDWIRSSASRSGAATSAVCRGPPVSRLERADVEEDEREPERI